MLRTALMTLAVVSAGLMAVSQASAADKFLADRHYQDKLECTNCHLGHEKSENFCAQCHDFKFNVP